MHETMVKLKIMDEYLLLDCVSECCGAPANSDQMICSQCHEHCDVYYEEN
jgi:hypothetical protein